MPKTGNEMSQIKNKVAVVTGAAIGIGAAAAKALAVAGAADGIRACKLPRDQRRPMCGLKICCRF